MNSSAFESLVNAFAIDRRKVKAELDVTDWMSFSEKMFEWYEHHFSAARSAHESQLWCLERRLDSVMKELQARPPIKRGRGRPRSIGRKRAPHKNRTTREWPANDDLLGFFAALKAQRQLLEDANAAAVGGTRPILSDMEVAMFWASGTVSEIDKATGRRKSERLHGREVHKLARDLAQKVSLAWRQSR